jgi:hypothetical protein
MLTAMVVPTAQTVYLQISHDLASESKPTDAYHGAYYDACRDPRLLGECLDPPCIEQLNETRHNALEKN